MRRTPKRGDIWLCDLDPTRGNEQQGNRPALVLTNEAFNKRGIILVCPITQGGNYARDAGFAVSLQGTGTNTQGIVMTHQSRTIDWVDRKSRFIEAAPDYITTDVIARLSTLLE